MNNEELIQKYEKYLTSYRKMNDATIRNYIYDIKAFSLFLNNKFFTDVIEEDIRVYIQDKKNKRKSANRINFSISSLSSFYKYLVKNGHMKINPMENIKVLKIRKKEVEPLNHIQVSRIREKLRQNGDTQLEVFFDILISGMPKKCSISNILWRKINWKKGYIEVELNSDERSIIYLDKHSIDALTRLRKERKDKNIKQKWVFITRNEGHWNSISDSTIFYWVNKIKNICELEELNFNILKKTTLLYWRRRQFSQEKINALISYRSFPTEIRSLVLNEIDEFYKNII